MYTICDMRDTTQKDKVIELLSGGQVMRSSELTQFGIDRKIIQRMENDGEIIRLSRGLYSLPNAAPSTHYSLLEAQKHIPNGVICLLSALVYHDIGTQNPHLVWMAIPHRSRTPKIENLPVKIVRMTDEPYERGKTEVKIEGGILKIYDIPKTVADCFKFRNKIGIDVAIEALKDVIGHKRATVDELLKAADVCRVRKIITPYLETLL